MVKMITDLLGQLTITDNGLELLCDALKDNIFDDNEFMEMICVTAVRIEDNILLDQLADVLAKIAFEKKTLAFIQNKILNDPSAVQFLKKCLWKIGK
jgi:ABC-type transport system involved in Fe-S cluster assembly fused permease/ATPase subunit